MLENTRHNIKKIGNILEFQELTLLNGWLIALGIFLGAVFSFFAITISMFFLEGWEGTFLGMKSTPTGFLGLISLVMLIVLIASTINYSNSTQDNNAVKFVSNLQIKYDISEVNTFEGVADLSKSVNPHRAHDSDIEITTKDGVRVRFLVTVDPLTFEPTLKEPTAISGISANELLKPL